MVRPSDVSVDFFAAEVDLLSDRVGLSDDVRDWRVMTTMSCEREPLNVLPMSSAMADTKEESESWYRYESAEKPNFESRYEGKLERMSCKTFSNAAPAFSKVVLLSTMWLESCFFFDVLN